MAPPIVLLHAYPVDRRMWAPVAAGLEAAEYKVVAPDLRGFGGGRRSLSGEPTLDVFADDIANVVEDVGGSATVIGLGAGGYVAMNLARRYPRHVDALVLANTRADADDSAARYRRNEFADRVEREGTRWVAKALVPKLLGRMTLDERPDVVEIVAEQISGTKASTLAWTQRAMAQRADSFDVLASFDGPTFFLGGEEDAVSPLPLIERMAEKSKGEMRVVQNAGHLSAIEAPAAFFGHLARWLLRTF